MLFRSLHGPEAIECLRHLYLSQLFSSNLTQLCQRIKGLVDDPSRLLASLRNAFYPELDLSELLLMTSANPDAFVESIHMPLLCIAAQHGYLAFAELLLKYHANVNIVTKHDGHVTALMLAAEHGHEPIVRMLLDFHADVSLVEWRGCHESAVCLDHDQRQVSTHRDGLRDKVCEHSQVIALQGSVDPAANLCSCGIERCARCSGVHVER